MSEHESPGLPSAEDINERLEQKLTTASTVVAEMTRFQTELDSEFNGDVFKIPAENLSQAAELANKYLELAEGTKPGLDKLAREIVNLDKIDRKNHQ